jgi:hypothetical protein
LDQDGVLANIDLHALSDRWSRVARVPWPNDAEAADLVFDAETISAKGFGVPVDARSDPEGRLLEIRVGTLEHTAAWTLSPECVALVHDNDLVGFVVRFQEDAAEASKPVT